MLPSFLSLHPDGYGWLPRLWRWCRRLPHRRGYGVHSPFAFGLITGVIYESSAYYAYASLSAQRSLLDGNLSEGDDRLLFRLANWAQAERIALAGQHTARTEAYFRAARPRALLTTLSTDSPLDLASLIATSDLIFLDLSSLPPGIWPRPTGRTLQLPSPPDSPQPRALLILRGIHHDAASRTLWDAFRLSSAFTLSFDLGRFGLLVRHPQLNKQDYVVNYW